MPSNADEYENKNVGKTFGNPLYKVLEESNNRLVLSLNDDYLVIFWKFIEERINGKAGLEVKISEEPNCKDDVLRVILNSPKSRSIALEIGPSQKPL